MGDLFITFAGSGEEGEGVSPKAVLVLKVSKGNCVNLRKRIPNPDNFANVLNGCSLTQTIFALLTSK